MCYCAISLCFHKLVFNIYSVLLMLFYLFVRSKTFVIHSHYSAFVFLAIAVAGLSISHIEIPGWGIGIINTVSWELFWKTEHGTLVVESSRLSGWYNRYTQRSENDTPPACWRVLRFWSVWLRRHSGAGGPTLRHRIVTAAASTGSGGAVCWFWWVKVGIFDKTDGSAYYYDYIVTSRIFIYVFQDIFT